MKKIIFLFLFFALWVNSAFSNFIWFWKHISVWWEIYKIDNQWYNNILINSQWHWTFLRHSRFDSRTRINNYFYDNWLKKYYIKSDDWWFYIEDNLSLTPIDNPRPCSVNWVNREYLHNWQWECNISIIEDWFSSSSHHSLFWNSFFYKYDNDRKFVHIKAYNDIKTYDFIYHLDISFSLDMLYTPNDHTVVWIMSNNDNDGTYSVFSYNFLRNRIVKDDYVFYKPNNNYSPWFHFSYSSDWEYYIYNSLVPYSPTYTWNIDINWSSLFYSPPFLSWPAQPCPPPYSPWECYNDPNYDPLTPPRDPNWPQGPITPDWQLPKYEPINNNNNTNWTCDVFKDWKFIYNINTTLKFKLTLPELNPEEAKVWWVDFTPLVNFIRSFFNLSLSNLENFLNEFFIFFSNLWTFREWTYCFLWRTYKIVYQEYLLLDSNNSVKRLLPFESNFQKWKQNIIDYFFLFILWFLFFWFLLYFFKK